MNKYDLDDCVLEALKNSEGTATIPTICKFVWEKYISKIEPKNDFFYTWVMILDGPDRGYETKA